MEEDQKNLVDDENPLSGEETIFFMGQKERRKSSESKQLLGDYIGARTNPLIEKLISRTGDTAILFADEVVKVNKRLKMQKRVFVITNQAIYNITPESYKLRRRIALDKLNSLSLSCLSDNFLALIVPSEYDYLIASSKKTEIVMVLMEAFRQCTKHPLNINFANVFEYSIDKQTRREIIFKNVEGGVSTQIYTKKAPRILEQ
ncbi:MAG: putative myosin IB heavy chain [Streblomastix strix]|uniref:Putative myosin IB heavy chain n=1 Tax=Streblomastix strix TaxID=222440 RepID=A0A5J4WLU2_9EUKA|nr:MAG: putative myosin IB heavy chain [Streblomastix strix]